MRYLEKNDLEHEIFPYISAQLRGVLKRLPVSCRNDMEEIRLGAERPVTIYGSGTSFFVTPDAGQTLCAERAIICSRQALEETISLLTKNSLYACTEQLKQGFLSLPYGHRAGIVGTAVLEKGEVLHFKEISGVNLRIRREVKGFANTVIQDIIAPDGQIYNTLILSAPQCGKTTLLRDITRTLGRDYRVGVVDERGEIAAMSEGVAQNDVGVRTEVISGCPKDKGMLILIRGMSPQVILTDEMGRKEDAEAVYDAINSGVKVITTVHGSCLEDLHKRPVMAELLPVFDRVILLSRRHGAGTVEGVFRRENHDF